MESIILIGMPGAGKTRLGSYLSKKLGLDFMDTDNLIEERLSMSIDEIFSNKGEECFRRLEEELLREVIAREDIIISTGGGIVLKDNNRAILSKSNTIYLKASIETIYSNIINDKINCRPLLKKGNIIDKLESMKKVREKYYIECSKYTIIVDNKGIDEISNEIIKTI